MIVELFRFLLRSFSVRSFICVSVLIVILLFICLDLTILANFQYFFLSQFNSVLPFPAAPHLLISLLLLSSPAASTCLWLAPLVAMPLSPLPQCTEAFWFVRRQFHRPSLMFLLSQCFPLSYISSFFLLIFPLKDFLLSLQVWQYPHRDCVEIVPNRKVCLV